MRRLLIVSAAILLAQLIAITGLAQQADSAKPKESASQKGVEGRWTGTVQTPNGDIEVTMAFKKDKDAYTGTTTGPQGELPLKEVKVDGEKVTALLEIENPQGKVVIKYDFMFKDDALKGKGKVDVGGQNFDFDINLKRAAEK